MDWNSVAVCGTLLFVTGALVAGPPAAEPAVRLRPLLAAGAIAFALAGAYSLAAPWLAQRELASSTHAAGSGNYDGALADAKTAHSYDPLSVGALLQQAALEPNDARARELYRKAVKLEPLN